MPFSKHGDIATRYGDGIAIQPDYKLVEKNDGTIEGQVTFVCDNRHFAGLPQIGWPHPSDSRAECYNREITYLKLGQTKLVASYFGIVSSKTNAIISYTPNTDRDPVTSHPDFATFAGSKSVPKNGAKFDEDTGEFLGFFDAAIKDLFGVEYYLVPSTLVSLSYWTNRVPNPRRRMTRTASIQGFRKPLDVKEFMLLDMPYRQVGSFYQVTEQYMGSGPNGFSKILYP